MAKKKKASRADAVRDAVDQAFKTQIPRDLLGEIGNTAGRLRGAVDELRPASEAEVKVLRSELEALSARVSALESAAAPRRRAPAAATAAAKPVAPAAAKPAAGKRAAAKQAAPKRASRAATKRPAAGS